MKVSVIIPNRNGGGFLGECLESVVSQDWPQKEIIVMDGGSTDLSHHIIHDYGKYLAHWESTPDGGPYHAVEKGLNRASGEALCWINSDDVLLPGALTEVVEIFTDNPGILWFSGLHATFLELSMLRAKEYPTTDFFLADESRYAVQLFRNADHIDWSLDYLLEEAPRSGYFLQQESTFWKRELWRSVGRFDHRYRLAGDYWLWLRFLERAPLTLVDRPFGCFRQTPGQRSQVQGERYRREAREIAANAIAGHRLASKYPGPGSIGNEGSSDETQPAILIRRMVKDRIILATSIAPFDINKQARCIRTWRMQGSRVLSFNTPDEIDRIKSEDHPDLRDLAFVPVHETARSVTGRDLVLLRDIIAYYQDQHPGMILGIAKSDVVIEQHIDLLSYARRCCDGDQCLVSPPTDWDDFGDRDGPVFLRGYDLFLFRSPHLRDFPMDAEFAIGAPWWDYFLPHTLSRAVETVYYPRPTPFYPMRDTTEDPLSIWVHYGEQFLRHLDRGLAERLAETPGLGYKAETLATITQQFASYFFRSCKARSPIEWAAPALYGNGSHSQIEELQNRIRQWADRAVLAEELLQQWAHR